MAKGILSSLLIALLMPFAVIGFAMTFITAGLIVWMYQLFEIAYGVFGRPKVNPPLTQGDPNE